MRRWKRRQWVWAGLYAVVTTVLVVVLVLIALGDLRLATSSSSGPSVTVSAVDWTVEQGTIASENQGWFGPSQFNYTPAHGWVPPTYPTGEKFLVTWQITNYDNASHVIYAVSVDSPFTCVGTQFPLPMTVVVGDEGGTMGVWVTSSQGGRFVLSIVVDALSDTGSNGC